MPSEVQLHRQMTEAKDKLADVAIQVARLADQHFLKNPGADAPLKSALAEFRSLLTSYESAFEAWEAVADRTQTGASLAEGESSDPSASR